MLTIYLHIIKKKTVCCIFLKQRTRITMNDTQYIFFTPVVLITTRVYNILFLYRLFARKYI